VSSLPPAQQMLLRRVQEPLFVQALNDLGVYLDRVSSFMAPGGRVNALLAAVLPEAAPSNSIPLRGIPSEITTAFQTLLNHNPFSDPCHALPHPELKAVTDERHVFGSDSSPPMLVVTVEWWRPCQRCCQHCLRWIMIVYETYPLMTICWFGRGCVHC